MTIPDCDPIKAMFIAAEVDDISRFGSCRNLASYAGLVPCLDASAGKERKGSVTKQGSRCLRTVLVEAVQASATMQNCRLRIFFLRRSLKAGYQETIVVTTHKILH